MIVLCVQHIAESKTKKRGRVIRAISIALPRIIKENILTFLKRIMFGTKRLKKGRE
jgi:hypothetical protein